MKMSEEVKLKVRLLAVQVGKLAKYLKQAAVACEQYEARVAHDQEDFLAQDKKFGDAFDAAWEQVDTQQEQVLLLYDELYMLDSLDSEEELEKYYAQSERISEKTCGLYMKFVQVRCSAHDKARAVSNSNTVVEQSECLEPESCSISESMSIAPSEGEDPSSVTSCAEAHSSDVTSADIPFTCQELVSTKAVFILGDQHCDPGDQHCGSRHPAAAHLPSEDQGDRSIFSMHTTAVVQVRYIPMKIRYYSWELFNRCRIPVRPGTPTWESPPYQPTRRWRRGRPPDTSPHRGRQQRLGLQGKRGRPPDEAVRASRHRRKKHRPPNLWRFPGPPAAKQQGRHLVRKCHQFRHRVSALLTGQWGQQGRPPDNLLWFEAFSRHILRRGRPPEGGKR